MRLRRLHGLSDGISFLSLEELKIHGDHVIFPKVIADFARGLYAVDTKGQLYYEIDGKFTPVTTVEYPEDAAPIPWIVQL